MVGTRARESQSGRGRRWWRNATPAARDYSASNRSRGRRQQWGQQPQPAADDGDKWSRTPASLRTEALRASSKGAVPYVHACAINALCLLLLLPMLWCRTSCDGRCVCDSRASGCLMNLGLLWLLALTGRRRRGPSVRVCGQVRAPVELRRLAAAGAGWGDVAPSW